MLCSVLQSMCLLHLLSNFLDCHFSPFSTLRCCWMEMGIIHSSLLIFHNQLLLVCCNSSLAVEKTDFGGCKSQMTAIYVLVLNNWIVQIGTSALGRRISERGDGEPFSSGFSFRDFLVSLGKSCFCILLVHPSHKDNDPFFVSFHL